jgi:hypothetical protein
MKKLYSFYLRVAVIVAVCVSFLNAQTLNVPQEIQLQTNWCWSACTKCVLDYYGFTGNTQCQIAEYARTQVTWTSFGSANCCVNPSQGCNSWNYNWGYAGSMEDILLNFGNVKCQNHYNALSMARVASESNAGNPYLIRWGWSSGGGHFMVGHGISGQAIYYMNPLPGYGYQIGNYNWVVNSSSHSWTHSQTLCEELNLDAISGSTVICAGSTPLYSVNAIQSATFSWTFPAGWNSGTQSHSVLPNAGNSSGLITVSAFDGCGQSASSSLSVDVKQVNAAVMQNGAQLTASETQAMYQWLSCPWMTPLNGETGRSFTPSSDGTYAVVVTKDGCSDTSSCFTIIVSGILLDEGHSTTLRVYPVPADNQIRITTGGINDQTFELRLINSAGQTVYLRECHAEDKALDILINIDGFSEGIYQLVLVSTGSVARANVVIK